MNYIYGFVVTLILALIIVHYQQAATLHALLSGFWEADSSFCKESGLDLLCIYFDEEYDISGSRPCYVLASQNDATVLNEPTVATISMQWFRLNNYSSGLKNPKYFNVTFKNISDESIDVFPRHQQMRFYPVCGKIVLFYDTTITAVLYKNPLNTELKALTQAAD